MSLLQVTNVKKVYTARSGGHSVEALKNVIMQKVGMTRRDIRRSVNSQMLTVFMLPVGMAGLHLFFASFIVRRLLMMADLDNTLLFAGATCGCFAVFAVVYGVVYRMTSNAYYRLVSDREAQSAA